MEFRFFLMGLVYIQFIPKHQKCQFDCKIFFQSNYCMQYNPFIKYVHIIIHQNNIQFKSDCKVYLSTIPYLTCTACTTDVSLRLTPPPAPPAPPGRLQGGP